MQIADVDNTQGQCGITVFRAMVASPSTGQITVTITGNSTPAAGVAMRFSGVDTTGTHGSGAVEASATDAGPAVDNNDMKLDVTTVTNNAWALGLGTHRGKTFTVPGGETGISINNSYGSGGDIASCSTWYESVATAGSTTVGADNDLDSDGDWCMVALSIKPYVAATAAFLGLLFEVGLIMGAVAAVPGVGQPMALRGTEVPGLRGWLAGRFRR